MRFRLTSLFVAAALLNALAQEGLSSTNSASVRTGDGHCAGDGGNFFASATCIVNTSSNPGLFGVYGLGTAYAGFGQVGALASATAPGVPGYHSGIELRANGTSTHTDIIFSSMESSDMFPAFAIGYFDVSGSLSTGGPAGGSAFVQVSISVGSANTSGSIFASSSGGPTTYDTVGYFNGAEDDQGQWEIEVPVAGNIGVGNSTTVSFSVTVYAGAGQNGGEPGIASFANANFSNTVSFARGRPVFDLPEGWTANSVSANIVNNYWIPPVPEPASALLGLIAAAGWSAATIRRKRR
jgi:hypothetical protein